MSRERRQDGASLYAVLYGASLRVVPDDTYVVAFLEVLGEVQPMTPLRILHHVMAILFPFILAGLLVGLWELL